MASLLVASADPVAGQALAEQLSLAGHAAQIASTPQEAREQVAAGRIDAAVTDGEWQELGVPVLALERPVRLSAALSSLSRLLSRQEAAGAQALPGGWSLDAGASMLRNSAGGIAVALTVKEAELLSFMAAAGVAVSRSALLEAVWGYRDDADTHTLETHLYRLRQKLKEAGATKELVETTPEGYRIAG